MNQQVFTGRVPDERRVRPLRQGIPLRSLAWSVVTSVALTAGLAAAQDRQPSESDKPAGGTPPSAAAGSPKWSCAEPSVEVAQLWHGGQIDCTFKVRNAGDADLQINVKGG